MVRILVRFPEELHGQLVRWAKAEQRSLNGMIIWLLTRAVREWMVEDENGKAA